MRSVQTAALYYFYCGLCFCAQELCCALITVWSGCAGACPGTRALLQHVAARYYWLNFLVPHLWFSVPVAPHKAHSRLLAVDCHATRTRRHGGWWPVAQASLGVEEFSIAFSQCSLGCCFHVHSTCSCVSAPAAMQPRLAWSWDWI